MSKIENALKILPSSANIQVVRHLTDGNWLALHTLTTTDQNKTVTFEVFEFDGDKIINHFHTATPYLTTPTPSGHTQLDGPTDIDTAFNTESTRQLVKNTVQATLVGGPDMTHVHDYMKDTYVQHHVGIPDGLNTVIQGVKMLKSAGKESIYTKINHIIADGNFALVISDGTAAGVEKTYYDLFRVEDSLIAEHWDIVNPA